MALTYAQEVEVAARYLARVDEAHLLRLKEMARQLTAEDAVLIGMLVRARLRALELAPGTPLRFVAASE